MSIHPKYASKILDGSKTIEFRKRPISEEVENVIVYMTSPVKKVVGEFSVEKQVVMSPSELWDKYGVFGGISHKEFLAYYGCAKQAVGILIKGVTSFEVHRPLTSYGEGIKPPQSFQYLKSI